MPLIDIINKVLWHLHLHCFVPLEKGECVRCDKGLAEILEAVEAHDQQVRKDLIEALQKYIDANNIYQVIFKHYEDLYKWVPLQTKRINITEVLDEQNK